MRRENLRQRLIVVRRGAWRIFLGAMGSRVRDRTRPESSDLRRLFRLQRRLRSCFLLHPVQQRAEIDGGLCRSGRLGGLEDRVGNGRQDGG
jgi:hypothetical protein